MTFYPTFNAAKWQGWKQTSAVTSHFKWTEAAALLKERGCLALETSRTSSLFEKTHLWPHLFSFFLMGCLFTANLMSYIRAHQASRAPEPAEGGQRGPWLREAVDPQLPFQGHASLSQVAGHLPLKKSQPNSSKLHFEHYVSFASKVKVDLWQTFWGFPDILVWLKTMALKCLDFPIDKTVFAFRIVLILYFFFIVKKDVIFISKVKAEQTSYFWES